MAATPEATRPRDELTEECHALDGEFGPPSQIKLTKRAIDALETCPGKNYIVFDEELPCFGIRVMPSGNRAALASVRACLSSARPAPRRGVNRSSMQPLFASPTAAFTDRHCRMWCARAVSAPDRFTTTSRARKISCMRLSISATAAIFARSSLPPTPAASKKASCYSRMPSFPRHRGQRIAPGEGLPCSYGPRAITTPAVASGSRRRRQAARGSQRSSAQSAEARRIAPAPRPQMGGARADRIISGDHAPAKLGRQSGRPRLRFARSSNSCFALKPRTIASPAPPRQTVCTTICRWLACRHCSPLARL
jgi:hypothetical protein